MIKPKKKREREKVTGQYVFIIPVLQREQADIERVRSSEKIVIAIFLEFS
jgi:bifunctional DNA-binding transcriptional regulator/antitoxin component of YhaV-PrlF toxin-antitoxin module